MLEARFWSLDDYKRLIQHEDYFVRSWAVRRIEDQYPEQAAECFVGLLVDPDTSLRITAAQALGKSRALRYELALRAALAESTGSLRFWIITALGQLRSQAMLPQFVAELNAAGTSPSAGFDDHRAALLTALGHYADGEAREALWHFVSRYPQEDYLAREAFSSILKFPEGDAFPQLVRRYRQLTPGRSLGSVMQSFAAEAGVGRLAEELTTAIEHRPEEVMTQLEEWLAQPVPLSATFTEALHATAPQRYAGLLPHISGEIDRIAIERGDDLAGWRADWATGQTLTGYRWRMTYASIVVAELVAQPSSSEKRLAAELGLCLALLGQAAIDHDDEAALLAALDELARRAVLLEILGSNRQNVLPDVVEQVAALGPEVVPDLIAMLRADHFWALPRALQALEKIARAQPGAADTAVPAILDLIHEDEGDYVLEPAGAALVAIGPAVVAPAAARLGKGDISYDIYVVYALGEIPTEAALDALLAHSRQRGLDEMEIEALTALGHHRAIPVLQQAYRPGNLLLAQAQYTLGLLNGYTGPDMERWRAEAQGEKQRLDRLLRGAEPGRLAAPGHPELVSPRVAPTEKSQRGAPPRKGPGKKELKKRKAQHKAQQKRKKKR